MKLLYSFRLDLALCRALILTLAMCFNAHPASAQEALRETAPVAARLTPTLKISAAQINSIAHSSALLSAAWAGKRLVAVGERGVILLSDDAGASFRQAGAVPVSAMLTSVSFVNASTGWATGHWGTILKTTDGGETWKLQRSDIKFDQPLFSIYFNDEHTGWAVGLWSLILATHDGGASWEKISLPIPPGASKADKNLFDIFPDGAGALLISSEHGTLIRSSDNGLSWSYLETGYKGSLWAGLVLDNGNWLVGGLRGAILYSSDRGQSWHESVTGTKSSVTALVQGKDHTVVATALDGVLLTSHDNGITFVVTQRSDQVAINAALFSQGGKLLAFSETGPLNNSSGAEK